MALSMMELEKKIKAASNSLRSMNSGLSSKKGHESEEEKKWREYAKGVASQYRNSLEEILRDVRTMRG